MENTPNTNQELSQTTPSSEVVQNTTPPAIKDIEPNALEGKDHGSIGPIIASIIIIILIVIGGIYFWGAILNDSGYQPQQDSEEVIVDDQKTDELNNQGTSDAVVDIETDLKATNIDNLEGDDLNSIESEF